MTVHTRFPFGFSVTLVDHMLQPVQRGGWDVMVCGCDAAGRGFVVQWGIVTFWLQVNMTMFGDAYFGHYFDLMNGE